MRQYKKCTVETCEEMILIQSKYCKNHRFHDIATHKCEYVFKHGEKAGQTCNRNMSEKTYIANNHQCKSHIISGRDQKNDCQYIWKRGVKKDQICGIKCEGQNTFCKKHLIN